MYNREYIILMHPNMATKRKKVRNNKNRTASNIQPGKLKNIAKSKLKQISQMKNNYQFHDFVHAFFHVENVG